MSKGSNRRPLQVDNEKFNSEWDRLFRVSKMVQAETLEDNALGTTSQGTILPMPASQRAKRKG